MASPKGRHWEYPSPILKKDWDWLIGFSILWVIIILSKLGHVSPYSNQSTGVFLTTHMSSFQNTSIIPWNTGWLIGIPRSWVIIITNILGGIIPYNHQPTGVLNTAHMFSLKPQGTACPLASPHSSRRQGSRWGSFCHLENIPLLDGTTGFHH